MDKKNILGYVWIAGRPEIARVVSPAYASTIPIVTKPTTTVIKRYPEL